MIKLLFSSTLSAVSYCLMHYTNNRNRSDTKDDFYTGPVEIAAVGVAIAIFNQASKVTIFPLVSITTSFVAEEDTLNRNTKIEAEKTEDLKKDAKSGEAKEPLPDDEMLDNMEKVSDTNSGKNIENKDSVSEDGTQTLSSSSIIFHYPML